MLGSAMKKTSFNIRICVMFLRDGWHTTLRVGIELQFDSKVHRKR